MKLLATTIFLLCTLLCSAQSNQTITFGSLPAKTLGDAPFTITASASSTLEVAFSSTNPAVATVSGSTITIVGVGVTMIKANQAGNGSFNPAPEVSKLLTVKNKAQTPADQGNIWGVTSEGGRENIGIIFKTNGDGTGFVVKKEFRVNENGCFPDINSKLVLANGKFYGLTPFGGLNNGGILFEFNPATGAYTKKVDIFNVGGIQPHGGLAAFNGKLYGTTYYGVVREDRPVIFEFDPATGQVTRTFVFIAGIGTRPTGGIALGTNNKFYGATYSGSVGGYGGIYEYDPVTNVATNKASWPTLEDGSTPFELTLAPNGKFYGVTQLGGASSNGLIFEFDPATSVRTKKYEFVGSTDGQYPVGGLVAASDGKLYGTTSTGGPNSRGTLFSYTPGATSIAVKHVFASDGGACNGTLTEVNGRLYGAEHGDEWYRAATIFEFDLTSGNFLLRNTLLSEDGVMVRSTLAFLNDKLYGLAVAGGDANAGTIFEYDIPSHVVIDKHHFIYAEDGAAPYGTLTQANNGKLYGVTSKGGAGNGGVLFEYDPVSDAFTRHVDFAYTGKGIDPRGTLALGVNGKLYGTTSEGGTGTLRTGTLFEFDPATNNFTVKLNFGSHNISFAGGSLVVANDGKLWGTSRYGGANSSGVIYEYDPEENDLVIKHHMSSSTGGYPQGGLVLASNGKFYGLTTAGGTPDRGTLYEFDPSGNSYTVKYQFNSASGTYPFGALSEANNKVYGLTRDEGSTNGGTLFEFDLATSALAVKVAFAGPNGGLAIGSMLSAANGKLYGMTNAGGASQRGVLFEFDPATGTHIVRRDFSGSDGARPLYSSLMQTHAAIRKDQTVTFAAITEKKMGDSPFTLAASATSGLPVQFSATGEVTISGNQATLAKPGSETITALQPGNADYHAAQVDRTFCVIPAKPVITMSGENTEELLLTSGSPNGNQWFLNNQPVSAATNATFSPVEAGVYSVKVSVDGCAGEMSDGVPLIVTGITEEKNGGITIHPNPVSDRLFVTLPAHQQSDVSIFPISGAKAERYSGSGTLMINLSDYNAGIYVLQVTTEKGSVFTQKFVKR